MITGRTASVRHEVSVRLPTEVGEFALHMYRDGEGNEHIALVMGDVSGDEEVLTRVHSECLTGDLFGSVRCDCRSQLTQAMRMISEEGAGVLLYLRQEGRGIGLLSKLNSYNLQDDGLDTVDANVALGYDPDIRDYEVATLILNDLGVKSIRLLSNNPDKFRSLREHGTAISSRVPIRPMVTAENLRYLRTKASRMHHMLSPVSLEEYGVERETIARYMGRKMEESSDRPFISTYLIQSLNGVMSSDHGDGAEDRPLIALRDRLRMEHDAYLIEVNGHRPSFLLGSIGQNGQGRRPMVIVYGDLEEPERQWLMDEGIEALTIPNDRPVEAIMRKASSLGIGSIMVEAPSLIPTLLDSGMAKLMVACIQPFVLSSRGASVQEGNGTVRRMVDHAVLGIGGSTIYYGMLEG